MSKRQSKLETQLKEQKVIETTVDLVNEFKAITLDRELVGQAVSILQPKNELAASVDTLLFRGRMEDMYRKVIAKNFTATTVMNIDKAETAVVGAQSQMQQSGERLQKTLQLRHGGQG